MIEVVRRNARKVWKFYLIPGLMMGGIKFLSAFTWFFYQPIAAAIGLSHANYGIVESATILGLGLIGAAIAIVAWPLVFYKVAVGAVPLSAVLFYPWVNPH